MKRFVWLLILALGTAFAQVRPVEPLVAKQGACDCCEPEAGACGMSDCAPVAACPSAAPLLAGEVSTLRSQAENVMPKSRSFRDHFYAQFSPRSAVPAEIAPQVVAPTASVPVFKAHCSFLI